MDPKTRHRWSKTPEAIKRARRFMKRNGGDWKSDFQWGFASVLKTKRGWRVRIDEKRMLRAIEEALQGEAI